VLPAVVVAGVVMLAAGRAAVGTASSPALAKLVTATSPRYESPLRRLVTA